MPASPWPGDARVAVMLTFDFEAESLWLARDPSHATRPGPLSQGRYGARVGVPRLLDLLLAREQLVRFVGGHEGVWWARGDRRAPARPRA
jgi:hypothetical protein